jgi:hypothetical protein
MQHSNSTNGADALDAGMVGRWRQPFAVQLLMLTLIGLAAYSLHFAPSSIKAAALKQLAEKERKLDDPIGAESHYRAALKLKPESTSVKVGLALLLFQRHRRGSDSEALDLLGNSILSTSEKVEVINAMPAECRKQFLEGHP